MKMTNNAVLRSRIHTINNLMKMRNNAVLRSRIHTINNLMKMRNNAVLLSRIHTIGLDNKRYQLFIFSILISVDVPVEKDISP